MKVLILAAGYGTRLYPIITDTPKPLLLIADKPLIDYALDNIRKIADLKEVIVVTNQKFAQNLERWAEMHAAFPAPVRVVNDGTTTPENRLGSVGDIQFVLKQQPLQDDLLVIGGDNLFDFRLDAFVDFARQKSPSVSIGLFDIKHKEEATKFGVVAIDAKGGVASFEEKPAQPKTSLIAMCVYYFPQETLGLVAQYLRETNKPDKAGDYIRWLVEKNSVFGYQFQGKWYDIGSLESYHEAQKQFEKKKK
jgi:glucose-1-phosphate thymidylyltransferase